MTTRDEIKARIDQDGIEFLLVQFVDLNGSAKVKMVPASELDACIDSGAGFAGAALWGLGQGPHDHDMLARVDLEATPPCRGNPTPPGWRATFTSTTSPSFLCPDQHGAGSRSRSQQGYVFNIGMEPEHFLVTRNEEVDFSVGSGRCRSPREALLRLSLDGSGDGLPAGTDQFAQCPGLGRLPDRP
ncbi:MAG: hypothetical protein CM1200mP2_58760 [Planctomycetaceae bacterium]|nr:MAG: hypothetical protein CM1200mP2_58760 [Planctomycetaceae bacterium]